MGHWLNEISIFLVMNGCACLVQGDWLFHVVDLSWPFPVLVTCFVGFLGFGLLSRQLVLWMLYPAAKL